MSLRSSSPVGNTNATGGSGISTAQAAAARQNGYLNQSSYTVRVPGSTGYSSLVSTTTSSGASTDGPHHMNQHHQQQRPAHHQEIVSVKPHSGLQSNVQSEIEQALVHAKQPLDNIRGGERVTAGPYSGIYLNKHEVDKWRGPIPIDQYPIHNDPNPEVIKKRMDKLVYTQELGVRYLNPPPAPKPGDLIIRERPTSLPPAPPLVLRQESERTHSPPPLIIREAPPRPPPRIPEQIIEVDAPVGPPPPRRVVLERFHNLPPKPQDIIVEKWLPYRPQKRRVVFQRAASVQHLIPKNLIIEWEAPDVEVVKQCRDLGVVEADPEEYLRRFGPDLKQTHELPTCEANATTFTTAYTRRNSMTNLHSPPPPPIQQQQQQQFHGSSNNLNNSGQLCYNCQRGVSSTITNTNSTTMMNRCPIHYGKAYQFDGPNNNNNNGLQRSSSIPDLEGDIDALRLVDLDKHGLGEYKSIVQQRHQISL